MIKVVLKDRIFIKEPAQDELINMEYEQFTTLDLLIKIKHKKDDIVESDIIGMRTHINCLRICIEEINLIPSFEQKIELIIVRITMDLEEIVM